MEIGVQINGKPVSICDGAICNIKDFYDRMYERLMDEEVYKNKCLLFPELKKRIRLKERATWYYKLVTIIALCLATLFVFCIFFECIFRKRDTELLLKSQDIALSSRSAS